MVVYCGSLEKSGSKRKFVLVNVGALGITIVGIRLVDYMWMMRKFLKFFGCYIDCMFKF